MPEAIHYRICGNSVALAVHLINSLVMQVQMLGDIVQTDQEIKTMVSLQWQYLTVWNVVFQIMYLALALVCDVVTLIKRDDLIPKRIIKFRYTLFESIVFPITLLIVLIFWPIFIYDRNLIFPEFIDRMYSFKSNLIIHLFILPVVLWELVFQPKSEPESHKYHIIILLTYYIIYHGVIIITYARRGLWPYPMLYLMYGKVYFPLFCFCTFFLGLLSYRTQWSITERVWGGIQKKQS